MKRSLIVCGAVIAASLSACVDFGKFTKDASGFASSLSPQISDLLASSQGLVDRVQKLPADVAGDVAGKVTDNHAKLTALRGEIDSLPAQIDEANKSRDAKKVQALLAAQKDALTNKVSAGASSLKDLSAEVSGAEAKAEAAAKAQAEAAAHYSKALPNGVTVKGSPTGVEAQLVAFISDSARPVDKTTYFTCDRLQFKATGADIDMEKSKEQLINLAEILRAYPKVKLSVAGYMDNKPTPAAAKKASLDRAKAIVKSISGQGIPAARLAAEGLGAEHPVCPANDTDECRAQNRRIALRVSAK